MRDIDLTHPLLLHDVVDVARGRARPICGDGACARIDAARAVVEGFVAAHSVPRYGINTGFGALAEVVIPDDQIDQLQHNLVVSHACGVGAPLDRDIVRAMMLLRAQVLAAGHSGVRRVVVETLCEMIGRGVHPVVPSQGSVGASGDLAPLAHLALVLIGLGEAEHGGEVVAGAEALRRAGIAPLRLGAKEGLSLINGTQAMTAIAAIALDRAWAVCQAADVVGALTVEAQLATDTAFDPRIVALRPYPGAVQAAANLRRLLRGSPLVASHAGPADSKVQDPYSIRCMPQVHGAVRDAVAFARRTVGVEINAVTDNPLVFAADGHIVSGGNFHGQPVAIACDTARLALVSLASMSERRIEQLVNPALNSGLPAFLARSSGLNSGFMIAQVTAAALVSESRGLAMPASVDSIPSSANREDHVSMGPIAARRLLDVVAHTETVIAIEALCAAQGVDQRAPLRPAAGTGAVWRKLREVVAPLDADRALSGDIAAATALVRSRALVDAAAAATGGAPIP